MFLDIIIPQYLERDDKIDLLLSSINRQRGVDFNEIGIIMINDKSDVIISDELINSYQRLNIKYLKNENNLGASLTRQRGLDESKAKYVTFLDADDYFYGNAGLQLVIGCLKETDADVVQTSFIGQRWIDEKLTDVTFDADYTKAWLHAKYIKRDFLIRNDIRFSSELNNNFEDSYFCTLVTGFEYDNKKAINIDFPTYFWNFNLDRIKRKKRKYHYFVEAYDDYLKCPKLVYEKLKNHNKYFADYYIKQATCNLYGILMCDLFKDAELKEKKNNYEKEFINFVNNHIDSFMDMNEEEFIKLYNEKIEALHQSLGIEMKFNNILEYFKEKNIIIKGWRI
jgi:glycosyltransferase involved in cell wall biosynthesis